MNDIINKELNIANMIYKIDGKEVMLDSDLAKLYKCKNGTKEINQAVFRNKDKFPERISWIINKDEMDILRSQNVTANISSKSRSNPRVFTEQGVYMLATILKSKVAIEVSIRIMDTFVKMRHYINFNKNILPNKILLLENRVDENTKRIDELFDKFDPQEILNNTIVFDGEIYNSYSLLMDIFNKAKKEIIIIDNYTSKELLDIIREINKKVIVVSKNITDILIKKYKQQYKNVDFIQNDLFHDRFIILDRKTIYTCGASFKDLGKKCFSINRFNDKDYLDIIIDKIDIN